MRIRIVAAFAAGLVAGSVGLASAGALPAGTQQVAHDALGAVGVDVPRAERYQGPECGENVKNHGQYVRSQPKEKRAEAAASRCGKPLQAGQGQPDADEGPKPDNADPKPDNADQGPKPGKAGECQGPPPWAGKGKPDKAAKAAWKQTCKPKTSTTTTTG